jgi:nitrogen fixation/metabolism regulation signal transduction histidine kinase
MFPRRLRLHYRIVIPFVLIAIVIPAVAAFVALSLVIRSLEARVETQVRNTALVVSPSDFALNASILARVKDITGSNVVTYTTSGAILASTLGQSQDGGLASTVTASDATREVMSAAVGTTVLRHTVCSGGPCYVAYRRVVARNDTIVAVIVDTSELNAATGAIARTILFSTGLSLVVMALVGQVVARRVTGPLDQLVAFTHDVSPGGSRQRAIERDDEIGRLAAAFNQMLDRLDRAQDALVRSEKLALAGLLAARVAHDIRNPLSSNQNADAVAAAVPDEWRAGKAPSPGPVT